MQASMGSAFLNLGARKAFVALCERLRALLAAGQRRNAEIREMLGASFARLNAEFGFSARDRQAARLRALRERAAADREQLRPVPRPDAGAAPGAAQVHGAVPTHAGLEAARRVREREQRDRALEQGGLGAGGQRSCASAARRSSGARETLEKVQTRRRRAREPDRRARGAGRSACSNSRRASASSPRRCASTRSRRRSRPTRRSSTSTCRCSRTRFRLPRWSSARLDARVPRDRSVSDRPDLPATFAAVIVGWQKEHGRHDLPWQDTRDPVPRLALRDHAAADAGDDGARLLRALPARFPDVRALAGAAPRTTCSPPGAASATTAARAICTAARRSSSPSTAARFRRRASALARAARHRPLDRGGDRGVLLRRARRDPRRQRQARARARARVRPRPCRCGRRARALGRRQRRCCPRARSRHTRKG